MPWSTNNENVVGLLPLILLDSDSRPAKDQLNDRYAHGGGYRPTLSDSWQLGVEGGAYVLYYPEDPPFHEQARIKLPCGETCVLFDASFMTIIQKDLSFVVTRVD